jgi:hypothetical protein
VKRYSRIYSFHKATPVTDEALLLVTPRRRNHDEFDSLVPGHVGEAEAAGSDFIAHGRSHP